MQIFLNTAESSTDALDLLIERPSQENILDAAQFEYDKTRRGHDEDLIIPDFRTVLISD